MKKILLQVILIMTFTSISAQVKFEKGYYIDQSNKKVECFIRNDDWIAPPKQIEYRLSESATIQEISFLSMNAFQIYNTSQYYIKSKIDIDTKTDKKAFNPTLENTVVKVILKGKASLYSISDMFFYSINDDKIMQLVYKKYVNAESQIMEENAFRRELYENLSCKNNGAEIRKLAYKEEKLIAFFKNYNTCQNSEFTTFADAKKKSIKNLRLLAGASFNKGNFPMKQTQTVAPSVGSASDIKEAAPEHSTNYLIGLEAEIVLPYQNYSWSIFTAPSYQKASFDAILEKIKPTQIDTGFGTLYLNYDYSYLDIPVGARRYFTLNKKSKLYVDVAFSLIIFTKISEIRTFEDIYGTSEVLENKYEPNNFSSSARIGFGYNYNNKYALSLNYFPKRSLSESKVDGFSLIASYKLF